MQKDRRVRLARRERGLTSQVLGVPTDTVRSSSNFLPGPFITRNGTHRLFIARSNAMTKLNPVILAPKDATNGSQDPILLPRQRTFTKFNIARIRVGIIVTKTIVLAIRNSFLVIIGTPLVPPSFNSFS